MKRLIKNVNVFDGRAEALREDCTVVIEDNLVKEIIQKEVSEESFDEVIDGRGMTAMPGMIDAHVHLGHFFSDTYSPAEDMDFGVAASAAVAKEILMAGFTTIRDAGGVVMGMKKSFDNKLLLGPRIFPSNSAISQTCGHGDSLGHFRRDIQYQIPTFSVLADGTDEVRRAVREQLYKGASQIKIMAGGGCTSKHDPLMTQQFSHEEMKAAVESARDYGTYVMAHLYTPASIKRAIKAGVRSFEHAHMMDDECARLLSSEEAFVAPMPQLSKMFPEGTKNINPKVALVKDHESDATELINKYDLKIVFGTDLMLFDTEMKMTDYKAPESLDLTFYKERFGSYKGLLAATGNCNDLLAMSTYISPYQEGEIGVLEEGSYADLLLVDGNPVADLGILADTDNIRLIMKDGDIYKNTIAGEKSHG